jgi:hypothetical protein
MKPQEPASGCPGAARSRSSRRESIAKPPILREYRYINRDSHTYIIEPGDRRIIEEID